MKLQTNKAFSLVEVMIVVVLVGILGYVVMQNLPGAKRSSEESQMRAKAVQLNSFMSQYTTEQSIRKAINSWSGKSNDQRYQMVRPYMEYSIPDLSSFVVDGYSIVFPEDPRQRVVIKDLDGNTLNY